jgi:hypothetical protein
MFNPIEIFSKQILRKVCFMLFFHVCFFCTSYAQQNDTIMLNLELGKRGNLLFNRQISFHNLGVYSSPFARIFFRESKMDEYKSIGFLGRKIKPFLQNNPLAIIEYKKFRNYKIASYATLASTPIVAVAWLASASFYNRRSAFVRRRGPLNLFPDGAFYLFPFSVAGLWVGSVLLNQQADHHLLMATEILNRRIKTLRPKK